jgi:hypothetical protein
VAALISSSACREELPQPPPFVSQVTVLSEGDVLMAYKEVSDLVFEVQPPYAAFLYDVAEPGCEVSIVLVDASGHGTTPSGNFKIQEISKISPELGQYRVKLLDKGSNSG